MFVVMLPGQLTDSHTRIEWCDGEVWHRTWNPFGTAHVSSSSPLSGSRMWNFMEALIVAGLVCSTRQRSMFFVVKSNGQLRLMFDTRLANITFIDPPHTQLPTAGSFSRIESEIPENYFACGDISCAFYHIGIPEALSQYLTLTDISAKHLGLHSR